MTEKPAIQKFKGESKFPDSEAAACELLRIYRSYLAKRPEIPHTYTGVTNSHFMHESGGTIIEYAAGRDFGIAQKWFRVDESGTRVFLLPDGEQV